MRMILISGRGLTRVARIQLKNPALRLPAQTPQCLADDAGPLINPFQCGIHNFSSRHNLPFKRRLQTAVFILNINPDRLILPADLLPVRDFAGIDIADLIQRQGIDGIGLAGKHDQSVIGDRLRLPQRVVIRQFRAHGGGRLIGQNHPRLGMNDLN